MIREVQLSNARYDHPPFFWAGTTDDAGAFKVATPAGSFTVAASSVSNAGTPQPAVPGAAISFATAAVQVEAGKYSEVTLTLQRVIVDQPLPGSGIRGLVLIGPVSPVTQVGVPNERTLAGALISVDAINTVAAGSPLPGFHRDGIANSEGRFEFRTPPGVYHVTARQPDLSNRLVGAPAVADVTVTDGKISDVTLHVDSGIR